MTVCLMRLVYVCFLLWVRENLLLLDLRVNLTLLRALSLPFSIWLLLNRSSSVQFSVWKLLRSFLIQVTAELINAGHHLLQGNHQPYSQPHDASSAYTSSLSVTGRPPPWQGLEAGQSSSESKYDAGAAPPIIASSRADSLPAHAGITGAKRPLTYPPTAHSWNSAATATTNGEHTPSFISF